MTPCSLSLMLIVLWRQFTALGDWEHHDWFFSCSTENLIDKFKLRKGGCSGLFDYRCSTYKTFLRKLSVGSQSSQPHLLSSASELRQGLSTRKKVQAKRKIWENNKGGKTLLEKITYLQVPEREESYRLKNFGIVMTIWIHTQS